MTDFNSSNLADVAATSIATAQVISATEHTAYRADVDARIADLNDMTVADESNYAGSSAPARNTVRGKLWADTSVTSHVLLKLDPDGVGADILLKDTRFPSINTTAVTVSTTTSATLMTYALDAGVLATNGDGFSIYAYGTNNAASGSVLSIGIGTVAASTHTIWNATGNTFGTAWFATIIILRESATKYFINTIATDDLNNTTWSNAGSLTCTWAEAQSIYFMGEVSITTSHVSQLLMRINRL